MANKLTPPPPTGIGLLDRWLALLWRLLTADGQIRWNQMGGGSTPFVPLDTTVSEPTRATGQIFWDSTNKTVAVHMEGPDVTLQIGQENHVYARNATGSTILNGKVVYVSGAQGNRPKISLAKADAEATAVGTIGLATEDIEDTTDGYVTTLGLVNGIDTSAFTEGDVVYLSPTTAGELTNVEPTDPDYIVRVGTVTRVNPAVGAILVNVQIITRQASEVVTLHLGDSTYSTVQDMQNLFHSAGYVSGGSITSNGDGTVAVAAGTGAIRSSNDPLAPLYFFDFAANASVSLTNNSINWIYIDYNSGNPIVTSSTVEPDNHHNKVKLASVYRDGTQLHINEQIRYAIGDHAANMVQQMQETMPYAHVSGAAISETGTRNLAVTAGTFWHGLTRFSTAALDTSVSGSFNRYYRNGVGGWTEVAGQTQVDNTQYDNGTGTLASLSALRYTNRWVYQSTDSQVHIITGQAQYVALADCQEEVAPSTIPEELRNDSFIIGRIIVRQGTATFIQVDSAFGMSFNLAQITDHGNLSGLADDDHTQYVLADGTRNITGPQLVTVNSASNALEIRQIGSGNALVIEDSTNPDSSPVVVDSIGRFIVGSAAADGNAALQVFGTDSSPNAQIRLQRSSDSTAAPRITTLKSRGSVGSKTIVSSGDQTGLWECFGYDGANFFVNASIRAIVSETPGTNDMPGTVIIATTADGAVAPSDRLFIDQAGNIGSGAAATSGRSFEINRTSTGNVNGMGFHATLTAASDVTTELRGFSSALNTAAASFTLASIAHYRCDQEALGGGSSVTNQYGFFATNSLVGATNNYGFYSDIPSAANRWNFFANGTANNAFNGNVRIGSTAAPTVALDVTGSMNVSGNATLGDSSADAHTVNGTLRLQAYTVATLPAAGTAGRIAYVTDATAPTYLGALVGGGAVVCPVFDNGTAWVSH